MPEEHVFGGECDVPAMADVLYEVLCRGPERCGMFVSAEPVDSCPRCGSTKVRVRPVPAG